MKKEEVEDKKVVKRIHGYDIEYILYIIGLLIGIFIILGIIVTYTIRYSTEIEKKIYNEDIQITAKSDDSSYENMMILKITLQYDVKNSIELRGKEIIHKTINTLTNNTNINLVLYENEIGTPDNKVVKVYEKESDMLVNDLLNNKQTRIITYMVSECGPNYLTNGELEISFKDNMVNNKYTIKDICK